MQDQGLGQTPDRGQVDRHIDTRLLTGLGLKSDEGVCRKIVHVNLLQMNLGDVCEP